MADPADQDTYSDEDFEHGGRKTGGKKKLFVFLFLLLLAGGGSGVYFSGILDKDNDEKVVAEADKPAAPRPAATSVFFDLPDMLVNLNSDESKPHYLKFRASLELQSEIDVVVLRALQPRVVDKFQVYMRELRLDDLRANVGMRGLREELLARVNEVITPVRATDVLFRNLLVQ